MRATMGRLFITFVVVAALAGCSSAAGPSVDLRPRRAAAQPVSSQAAVAQRCRLAGVLRCRRLGGVGWRRRDPRLRPRLQAGPAHGRGRRSGQRQVRQRWQHAPQPHFADGTTISADGGATATGTVNVPAAGHHLPVFDPRPRGSRHDGRDHGRWRIDDGRHGRCPIERPRRPRRPRPRRIRMRRSTPSSTRPLRPSCPAPSTTSTCRSSRRT